ncbi:hypothetical protein MNBD_BACTEROID03-2313 [hydrothermal vent metagenome]|uniref:Uncharacterized protein n=1 Tax=hydrothermal vent metagenome TaxID=652676 RepID=A0A3B0TM40_9ZZZZ
MKLYYVYILLCSDGLTYTGLTNINKTETKAVSPTKENLLNLSFVKSSMMLNKQFTLKRKLKNGVGKRNWLWQ